MKALLLFLLISSAWELRFGSERRIAAGVQSHEQASEIKTTYDSTKDKTTVSLPRVKVSGAKEKYISLHVAASFSYSGHTPVTPEFVNFEIHSVVKARKLDPDLYVVLLLDGETIFLSSNRSAVRNPVPGKPWIGERMVFRMPYDTLIKLTSAKVVAIRMDGARFDVAERSLQRLRDFQTYARQH